MTTKGSAFLEDMRLFPDPGWASISRIESNLAGLSFLSADILIFNLWIIALFSALVTTPPKQIVHLIPSFLFSRKFRA